MYKVRHIFNNDNIGKKRSLDCLEFALQDNEPWFLCIAQKDSCQVKFSNWVIKENAEEAKFCIQLASKEICFYQMTNEVDDKQAVKILKGNVK